MTPTIHVGTILIENQARIMQFFGLESEAYSGQWSVVRGLDGSALGRKIHAAGWNFFFMGGGSESDVPRISRNQGDPERDATNSRESKAAEFQLP